MSSQHNKNLPAQKSAAQAAGKKKKKIIAIVSVSVVVAIVIGVVAWITASNWEENQKLAADRKTVATCNGFEIPYEELRFLTLLYKDSLELQYGEGIWDDPATAEEHREELETMVMDNLNKHYLILTTCKNLQIPTSSDDMDDYVNKQMKLVKAEFESTAEYQAWLEEQGMTEHYMRFSIGVSFLESAIYYTLLDNDLYAFRQDNIEDFKAYVETSDNYVRTLHVFIENVKGEDPAANLAKAQEISDELQAIEDDFDRRYRLNDFIGSSVNDDLLTVSGDGYYFTQGEMEEAYERAAFALEIGGVSEPVVCSGGNFVIMRLEPDAEYIERNAQTLLNNYHSVALGMYVDQYRSVCVPVLNEYGESLDLVAMK